MKKNIVVGACILFALLVIVGIWAFIVFGVPTLSIGPFKKQIEARSYQDAELIYEDFSAEDKTKANAWMKEYIKETENSYYEGKLDCDSALEIIEEMMRYNAAYDTAAKAGEAIIMDDRATESFEKAKEYAEDECWDAAYLELEDIHVKYRLYDEVVAFREACVTNFRTDILEQMEESAQTQQIDTLQQIRDSALQILPDDKQIIEACQGHLDEYVDDILTEASKMAEEKDYSMALQLLRYAYGEYTDEKLMVAQVEYEYAAIEAHCEALIAEKDYLGAVKYAQEQSAYYPKCSELVAKYAEPLVQETLDTAQGYVDSEQYEKAIEMIATVVEVYDHEDLVQSLSQIRYAAVVSRCEALVEQEDLLGAVKYAKEHSGDDSRCVDLMEQYAERLVEDTLEIAQDYAKDRRFQDAIDSIEVVRAVYDRSELAEAVEEYTAYLPISLADCLSVDGEQKFIEYGDIRDAYDTIHKNSLAYVGSSVIIRNKYYLADKYVSIMGTLSPYTVETSATVAIYLDGKCAYTMEDMTLIDGVQTLDIDVTNVKEMVVEVTLSRIGGDISTKSGVVLDLVLM